MSSHLIIARRPVYLSSSADFVSGLVRSLPPLHEITQNADVERPDFFGKRTGGKGTKLDITSEVGVLAQTLVEVGLIPNKAASDAIHIAVASVHKMDYPVTWNFKHIANPFIRDRLRRVIHESGFHLPVLCSPDELLEYNEDN